MSEFHIRVVKLPEPVKHPNADTLDIFYLGGEGGYPVISQTGNYKGGDLAAYLPVDAIVPPNDPRFDFLGDHRRIKAKRLRGVFSMGLLTPAEPGWVEGQDVRSELGIEKHLPPEEDENRGEPQNEKDPGFIPCYTDIEGLRRYPTKLVDGEEVILREKIHGENGRLAFHEGRLWVGSRTKIKLDTPASAWWKAARSINAEEKLRDLAPGIVVYGESHGYTGGYPYGQKQGKPTFRAFDAYNIAEGRFLDHEEFEALMAKLGFPTAPVLHRGPWSDDLRQLAEGPSTLDPSHIREGFVVKPVKERWDQDMGRVVLKHIGEAFLLKKK